MILVFNFGGQYAHLIARRVRELGVKSQLISPEISHKDIRKLSPQAIILSGSPFSCYGKNAPRLDPRIYDSGIPILGICYGHQLLAYQLKGKVTPGSQKQFGKESLKIKSSPLFAGLSSPQTVWFSHGDRVTQVPSGFTGIATTSTVKIAAMQNLHKKLFGIQFHAEVTHTPNGQKILSNFLFKIAKVKRDWDLPKVKENLIANIKKEIGSQKIVMALSGGVDSLVAATLIKEAVGNNLHCVFIDTGLLRKYDLADLQNVVKMFDRKRIRIIDAQKRFLKILKGVIDPEEKRQKIAKLYFTILEEEAQKIGDVHFLGQGTIYPDRIESAQSSKHADKIKSHHNVTLPRGLKLKIIEPLADFYKDEVRKLGQLLGISSAFLKRHPFPGPGLAIRILGEVTEERLKIVREADAIFIEELKKAGLYNKEVSPKKTSLRSSPAKRGAGLKVGQALVALLPVKSVGVMGDARTYSYIVSLRSVDTTDFMTADWSKIPHEVLEKISSRIVNEVRGVNRVVYDITQKPPATIEYE